MEKNRNSQVLAIVALLVAIAGVSLGFAAFSRELSIQPSADVKFNNENEAFKVVFSKEQDSLDTSAVTGTPTGQAVAAEATINNETITTPSISGLKATIKAANDTVSYTFYVRNEGDVDAYLNAITFEGTKTCTGKEGATDALVQKDCANIKMEVTVGEQTTEETVSGASITADRALKAKGQGTDYIQVVVKISHTTDTLYTDGDFDVTLPKVKLTYSSVQSN